VPSYKSIAIAILQNDLMLRNIGFYEEEGELAKYLRSELKKNDSKQLSIF
jgi:predicted phosphoadenosine phosphosulfate sulfurtransferase